MPIEGIDVSNNNGAIAWDGVAGAGIRFAIHKASEGVSFFDSYFPQNLAGARAHYVMSGAYHFARPASFDFKTEADWFLSCISPYIQTGEMVVLDLEQYPTGPRFGDVGDWVIGWMARVGAELGCKPLLYTNLDMIQNYGLARQELADNGLWLASPGTSMPAPPAPWPVLAMWQKSWIGSVRGIQGQVDLDVFNGDAEAFRKYGVGQINDNCVYVTQAVVAGFQTALQARPRSTAAKFRLQGAQAVLTALGGQSGNPRPSATDPTPTEFRHTVFVPIRTNGDDLAS